MTANHPGMRGPELYIYIYIYITHISSNLTFWFSTLCYRCILPSDDHFRACFGCENIASKSDLDQKQYGYQDYDINIERQTGEIFQTTKQSRRVICRRLPEGGRTCFLRIDRAMQLRRVSYGRALQFVQSEQYLGNDDVDLIR